MSHDSRRPLLLWAMWWIGMVFLLHVPWPKGQGPGIPYADKVVHFTLYAVLTVLCARWLSAKGAPKRSLWTWVVVFGLYGIVDEITQPLTDRTASLADYVADVAGIAVGAFVAGRWWLNGRSLSPGKSDQPGTDGPLL